ncbi:glycosyltransferase [Georgenia sp. Z1344]|uniref:glycosyltransferase n=1 Tax=Georgenia sp. Z1344 TaxID=3416706 RepID=UPI003CE768CD
MSPSLRDVMAAGVRRLPDERREAVERRLFARELRAAGELVPYLPDDRTAGLLVGPTNTAGQGYLWARAVEEHLGGVAARSVTLERPGGVDRFSYPTDVALPLALRPGRAAWRDGVLARFSHALFETGYSPTTMTTAVADRDEIERYRAAGVTPGVVFHGSEIRDPDRHAELYPTSPYRDAVRVDDAARERIRAAQRLLEVEGLPAFVTTPDQLDLAPGATLLPIVVDVEGFAAPHTVPALGHERPIVLHAPSNPALKGTAVIEPVLEALDAEGRITYRRLEDVPHERMTEFVAGADVVVDQILLGAVGVLAAEAMAAGRLVVGHVHERVRARLDGDLPVVDATPETFAHVMDEILTDRDRFAEIAVRGPDWARTHHDGRASAAALAPFLGVAEI